MQPVSEVCERLFYPAGVSDTCIAKFSCGHVIPPQNLLPIIVKSGPTGMLMDFSYQKRDQKDTVSNTYSTSYPSK